jgi:hypothetical protein
VGSLLRRVAMVLLYAWVVVVLLAGETANLGCNLMAGLKSASSSEWRMQLRKLRR